MKFKKIVTTILAFTSIFSSISIYAGSIEDINASSNLKVIGSEVIAVEDDNYEEIFKEYNIEIPQITDSDLFTNVDYGDITVEYFSLPQEQLSLNSSQLRIIQVPVEYNTDWIQDNTTSKGLKYWVDVAYNLSIGSKTKYAWKFSTIFGINPSNFLSDYQKGDYAGHAYRKIYTYKYAQVNPGAGWTSLVTAEYLELSHYAQLRGMDVSGQPVDENTRKDFAYSAPRYHDNTWLLNRASYLYDNYGIINKEVYNIE